MHYFYNFKGFRDAQIDLFRPMTLLIGRNGSGKTNVIEGVELLAQLASGRPLYEISDIGSSNTYQIRGGLPGCMRIIEGNRYYPFGLGFEAFYSKQKQPISYFINIGQIDQPRITEEKLIFADKTLFHARSKENSEDLLNVTYDNFSRGQHKPSTSLSSDRSILSRYPSIITRLYEKKGAKKPAIDEALEVAAAVSNHLKSAFVFDFNQRSMRQFERIGSTQLRRDGSNLSAVLHYIQHLDSKQDEQKHLLPRILEKLKQLPEEPYTAIEFITTPTNDALLALKRQDGALIDARLLSDGTLRALAILTALETVPEYSRIVIEELDNGIHPSRVKLLVDTIWECSQRRNLNVLATTHNPATLNGLTTEQLDCVVVCHYDPVDQVDKLSSLSDLPYADVLLQKGPLGDLVTRNVLEHYLMPGFEEQQQQRHAKEWLDLFI